MSEYISDIARIKFTDYLSMRVSFSSELAKLEG